MQVFRRIAADIQVGTLQRAVGAESGDDDETTRPHGAPDLFDMAGRKVAKVEATMDALRERFGRDAVMKGRSLNNGKKR